jgi:D-alanine-D-alanine ligase-like ATP-grasp enzyme
MREISRAGFAVPRWIVTNEPIRAKGFIDECKNGAVVKSCSGLRRKVEMAGERIEARLEAGSSPVVFQEFIPGREVRVHVVGSEVFPIEVFSPDVDYRLSDVPVEYAITTVPRSLEKTIVDYARQCSLCLAGFDFRVLEETAWYCLEMNPVPSFLPYEMATGAPIASAVIRHLCAAG